jgi:hypothetical protein
MPFSVEQKREALVHKTFVLMFRILIIFAIPAIIAYFLGQWIDTTYDIRPKGTLMVLPIAFITSWVLVIRIYQKLTKQFQALREEEAVEQEKRQKAIQKKLTDDITYE